VTSTGGGDLTVTGPVVSDDPACSGTTTSLRDALPSSGVAADWTYTYTINPPTSSLPADDGSTVDCIEDAQIVPTPPTVTNSCGDDLTVTGPVVGDDPECSGTKTYTWTYEDCTGETADWTYTYTISPPTFTLPGDDGLTVDCIEDAQV